MNTTTKSDIERMIADEAYAFIKAHSEALTKDLSRYGVDDDLSGYSAEYFAERRKATDADAEIVMRWWPAEGYKLAQPFIEPSDRLKLEVTWFPSEAAPTLHLFIVRPPKTLSKTLLQSERLVKCQPLTDALRASLAAFKAAELRERAAAAPYEAATVEGAKTAASMDIRRVVQSSLLPRGQADTTFPSALPTKGCDMFTHRRFVKGAEGGFVGGGVLPREEYVMSAKPEPQPAPIPAEQQFILDYAALCEKHGLVLHTYPYGHLMYLGTAGGQHGEPAEVALARLIMATRGDWCPELKALFLRLVGKMPYLPDGYEENISRNVRQRELQEARSATC